MLNVILDFPSTQNIISNKKQSNLHVPEAACCQINHQVAAYANSHSSISEPCAVSSLVIVDIHLLLSDVVRKQTYC